MSEEQVFHADRHENTYVIDSESSAEMARLMRQDHLLTKGMGGLFPEGPDLSNVQRILDVGCGPGGWVLEVAFTYTDIDVVGIDISQTMIAYANAQARVQKLSNAHFEVMNALQPLKFPDASFDLVNARTIAGFMSPRDWPVFMRECLRILRPGGMLRITEGEWAWTNQEAFEKLCWLGSQAMRQAGRSFSPNGLYMGVLPMLRHFLLDAGYVRIGKMAHALDYSSGEESHESFCYDMEIVFKLLQPFLLKCKVATQEELDNLYERVMTEIHSEDFWALSMMLTTWGYKSE